MKRNIATSKRSPQLLIFLLAAVVLLSSMNTTPLKAADNKNYPVLLIHGLASSTDSWKEFPKFLTRRGHDVFLMDWKEWTYLPYANRTKTGFDLLAAVVARQINLVKQVTGKDKVNIVAHSIGGIAVRAYMANWGERMESRGKYGNDINRVIYLGTPHFGLEKMDQNLRKMLKDTDYGGMIDPTTIMNSLKYTSPELMSLYDYFCENGGRLGVEELTIHSEKDRVMKPYGANLDGLNNNPFIIPRSSTNASNHINSRHINIKWFEHAYHETLGKSKKTILGVAATNHPVLKATVLFFKGDPGWKNLDVKISGVKDSLVIFRVEGGGGIDLKDFKPYALQLKQVKGKKKKTVKLTWNPQSKVFYFTKFNSGLYELSYPPATSLSIRFDLNIIDGASQVATFDLLNPPFDPAYKPVSGDENIRPGQIPSVVNDYNTLRRFVIATFPFESRTFKTARQMKVLVKTARNAMANIYPNLARKNDIDKMGLSELETVDFVSGANTEGILANKLEWSVTKKEPPDNGGGGGGGTIPPGIQIPSSPPSAVYDKNSLLNFALWKLKEKCFVHYSEKKIPAAIVRDSLAEMYSDIKRLNDDPIGNGYTASEHKHRDAFWVVSQKTIIDFVTGSSAPGKLYYSLGWGRQPITPW